jgi:mevalonate pyrophosphate decarboxylase
VTIDAGPQVKVLCEPADAPRIASALRDVPGVGGSHVPPGNGAEVRA